MSNGSSVVYVTVTNPDGVVTVSPTATMTGGSSGSSSSDSSNHTGAIVGGVVGGVAGLALIAIVLWFLLRRRKSHRDDFDDMMFDPGRPENQAPIDLGQDGGAPTVEPFYAPGVASTAASPEMSQYPRSAATISDGGYGAASSGGPAPSIATSAGFAGRGAGGHGMYDMNMEPMPMPTAHPTGVDAATAAGAAGFAGADLGAMGAKQREAFQEQQRFRVQNQGLAGSSGAHAQPMSPTSTDATNVTVHRDAGAIEDEEESYNNDEIPPTYESIGRRE